MIRKINYLFNTYLIEKNPVIVSEMLRHNKIYGRIDNRKDRAKFVLQLYLKYGILHQDPLHEFEKRIYNLPFPETKFSRQNSLEEMKIQLKHAEAVAFDIWGVMVCMAVNEYQLRAMNECVSLSPGISEYGENVREEITDNGDVQDFCRYEKDFVLDNPFIHKLWDDLWKEGKTLYINNNSPYDNQLAAEIVMQCGYKGQFYDGGSENVVHVTNIARCSKDIVYVNINRLGDPYRIYYDYNVVTNTTDRIINLLLHGDDKEKSMFYEYGVICGGILTCGFCDWLNELADRKNIDLFLFVARDGEIMQKIYQKYYAKRKSEYLIFSRFASFELIFADYPEEYIDKNIKPRIERENCDNSITKILTECGLEFMKKYLPCGVFAGTDILNEANYERFKNWLLEYKEEIEDYFKVSCIAAEQYYRKICKNYHKICVVDLGWHGKSIIYLKHFMERKCEMNVQVTGAMIGAASDVVTQDYIRRDLINTYAFEDDRWRAQGSKNGDRMDYKEIICTEALYSSTKDTLLRYKLDKEGRTIFVYGKRNENVLAVGEMHRGIMDFAKMFSPVQKQYGLRVMPRDAYAPLSYMMKNRQFLDWLYCNYREEAGALNGFT